VSALAHVRTGSGPRGLVLLHGFLGSRRNVSALGRRLADGNPGLSVFAMDLSGHGDSPALPDRADLATLAADVLETVEKVGIPRPLVLVGHSLGGRVALKACLAGARTIAQVALLDITASPVGPGGEIATVLEALLRAPDAADRRDVFRAHFRDGGFADPVVDWLLLNLTRDGEVYRWRIDRGALAALHRRTSAEDLWPAVETPRAYGVHVLRGALSSYVDDTDARRFTLNRCPVDTIAGAGHWLHVERPADVVDRLLERLP
jgi:esterase